MFMAWVFFRKMLSTRNVWKHILDTQLRRSAHRHGKFHSTNGENTLCGLPCIKFLVVHWEKLPTWTGAGFQLSHPEVGMHPNHIMRIVNRQNHLANPPIFWSFQPVYFPRDFVQNLNEKSSHHRLLNGFLPPKKKKKTAKKLPAHECQRSWFFPGFPGQLLGVLQGSQRSTSWIPIGGWAFRCGFFSQRFWPKKRAVGVLPLFGGGNVCMDKVVWYLESCSWSWLCCVCSLYKSFWERNWGTFLV